LKFFDTGKPSRKTLKILRAKWVMRPWREPFAVPLQRKNQTHGSRKDKKSTMTTDDISNSHGDSL
jgi:hypothetical protein